MSSSCAQLEDEFAAWLGVRGAVATGFGRGALWLALEAAGVSGGEVAVPELICAQVTEAVRRAGARPAFYPVRRDLSVDAQEFEAVLGPRTRAAIVVHYWGRVLPAVASLAEVCRRRGVFCLEDCALSLGAALGGHRAGTFGAAAVFSFTKSDWCYGGGLVSSDSEAYLSRLRILRQQRLRRHARLSFNYGLLRRADCATNRPRWCALASQAGLRLQQVCFPGASDFYEAGRADAAMPSFAARRASIILRDLPRITARRREIVAKIRDSLPGRGQALFWPDACDEETAAFLPLRVISKHQEVSAMDWMHKAAGDAVTLRLAWPAYQPVESGQSREALAWWADRLAILEVNPKLSAEEVERISKTVGRLAGEV